MYLKQLESAIDCAIENKSFNKMNVIEQADNICVFGLGTYFKEAFVSQNTKEKYNVNLLCDNDPEKWGKTFEGLKCVSPEDLKNYDNLVVIIMVGNPIPVKKQLRKMGIRCMAHNSLSLDHIMEMPKDINWFKDQKKRIISAYNLFEDNESKKIYVNGLCNRIAPSMSEFLWDELYSDEGQYFYEDCFKLTDNEVYVDCGAYTGDTVIEFCNVVNNKYDKVFAFELDENHFATMSENVKEKDITLYNYGVWSENKDLDYGTGTSDNEPMDGISVYKTEKSKNNVIKTSQVKKLDDILSGERITFIKMDVEGSEFEALKGAENIIRTQKPKLAICVYHRTSDFWEIPLLIKKFNNNYNFAIRHHKKNNCETVVYAW